MTSSQNGRGAHAAINPSASKFFEKTAPGLHAVRRSTPDSEALASSDDDHEHPLSHSAQSLQSIHAKGITKPVRRSSWLSEVQSGTQRKFSIGSAGSQPTTPATESGFGPQWSTLNSRPPPVNTSYPWSGAWPASGTHQMSLPESNLANMSMSTVESLPPPLASPSTEDNDSLDDAGSYQFNVSYTPVRKNVRSQSYSAGQQQPSDEAFAGARGGGRAAHRAGGNNGSRPSLGLVMEDESDDLVAMSDDQMQSGSRHGPGRIDQMTASHGVPTSSLLKQAAVENALSKQRSPQAAPQNFPPDVYSSYVAHMAARGLQDPSDTAWLQAPEFAQLRAGNVYEAGGPAATRPVDVGSENVTPRPTQHQQQPTWSSNLGFGKIIQPSESRRASFADPRSGAAINRSRTLSSSMLSASTDAGSEASGHDPGELAVADDAYHPGGPGYNPYAVPNIFTTPSPDLYIVAFKCARAGTFYVPPNTGLEVKVGDMVIVEGDRGIDLGTVTHARITMADAKVLTQQAKDSHFKWLMMFSRTKQPQSGGTAGIVSTSAAPEVAAGGGGGGGRSQPSNSKAEDRPKMIRGIATNHQIQQLREKEGAEAKAKRVAQVKVGEHSLDMEILDAEMQYDWKKLTFFFYSPKYVNFNNLVIDLFKIYKTRIWMDAITNGTSQAAQDEVLGAARPLVASSQSAAPPPTGRSRNYTENPGYASVPHRLDLGAMGRPEDAPPDMYPVHSPYGSALASPLQATFANVGVANPNNTQAYAAIPAQAGYGGYGSPPLSASAYPPYDSLALGGDPPGGLPHHYAATATSPTAGAQPSLGSLQHHAWKQPMSPTSPSKPPWNLQQQQQQPVGRQQLHPGLGPGMGLQRANTFPANPNNQDGLAEYLRGMTINSPR